jgi:predicted methyltransferase
MTTCPACAGPQALGGNCATCNGTTEVTQEVYNSFLAIQTAREEAYTTLDTKLATLDLNEYELEILAMRGFVVNPVSE